MSGPHDLLAEIRSLELQMAQELDDARAAATEALARARAEGRALVDEAAERGSRHAEERHRDRLVAAAVEAERTRQAGEDAAAELLASLRTRFGELVDDMVEVVLTTSDGGE